MFSFCLFEALNQQVLGSVFPIVFGYSQLPIKPLFLGIGWQYLLHKIQSFGVASSPV